jgi:hypothetical protein
MFIEILFVPIRVSFIPIRVLQPKENTFSTIRHIRHGFVPLDAELIKLNGAESSERSAMVPWLHDEVVGPLSAPPSHYAGPSGSLTVPPGMQTDLRAGQLRTAYVSYAAFNREVSTTAANSCRFQIEWELHCNGAAFNDPSYTRSDT